MRRAKHSCLLRTIHVLLLPTRVTVAWSRRPARIREWPMAALHAKILIDPTASASEVLVV